MTKEEVDNLVQENEEMKKTISRLNKKIETLMKQCDGWVKSYNKLLEDLIYIRSIQKGKE